MRSFDCLSPSCPLFGPHLLEASAGTGKTFSIEHIYVRLLLEAKEEPLQIEEILVVTFTRAATRELKSRIRANLEKALVMLKGEGGKEPWPYLISYIGSSEAIQRVDSALGLFDRCQIFTIHGFCYRVLKEFAFEANLAFSLSNPDQEKAMTREIERAREDFLKATDCVCPEQMTHLLAKHDNVKKIGRAIEKTRVDREEGFQQLHREFSAALQTWAHLRAERLEEDFEKARANYKRDQDSFAKQLQWLIQAAKNPEDPSLFQKLIREKASLFTFLSSSNRKVRAKEVALHNPGFFDWASATLGPIVDRAKDPKVILAALAASWNRWKKEHVASAQLSQSDEILDLMKQAIESDLFLSKLRCRFKAVIIDEFQDTDPLQWDIFQKVFLESDTPLRAVYLVGDPKQSIYRFRRADVYTYFKARECLGEANLYHLDTNFRSSKELIGALNALFHREWLSLPGKGSFIPYHPVKAGAGITTEISDCKAALHWIVGDANATFEKAFLPYAVAEIERQGRSGVAILVKDRFEAQMALDLLRARGIPAIAKSHLPIGQTAAFREIRAFLEAVRAPADESLQEIVAQGPFRNCPVLKSRLEEEGLARYLRAADPINLDPDSKQVIEELLSWERKEGFSFEGLTRFLDALEALGPDEGGRRRMEEAQDAVQILTMHISKGLEFDVVFALGLASSPPRQEEADEELEAEKLRQLYVSMTRAKRRLYVPYRRRETVKGPLSPMELFCQRIEQTEGAFLPYLEQLKQRESVTVEEIATPYILGTKAGTKEPQILPVSMSPVPFSPIYLNSFTSLARPKEKPALDRSPIEGEIPRGAETGVLIHQIFEALFSSAKPIWKEAAEVDQLVEQQLRGTPLVAWIGPIQEMVRGALRQTLFDRETSFALQDLEVGHVAVEMEFLYPMQNDFVQGFIDLVFSHQGKYYLLDWKTNWLRNTESATLWEEMKAHDYELQAALYAEALQRSTQGAPFGGAFYLFVRHGAYLHFHPNMGLIHGR